MGMARLEMSLGARVTSVLCSSSIRVVLGLRGSPLWVSGVQVLWGCPGLFTLGTGWKP